MQTLQQLMEAIAAEHGFYSISVGLSRNQPSAFQWTASVLWKGFTRDDIGCKSGIGANPEGALTKAVENAAMDRKPFSSISQSDIDQRDARIAKLREQLEALTGEAA